MDEDVPALPADTLEILQQFLKERESQETVSKVSEDWNLSQFWYNNETQKAFGRICKKLIKEDDLKVVLLSAPSLYETIKNIVDEIKIFEFDKRFEKYGQDFVFYDYNHGDDENYLNEFSKKFNLIIVDPPFLSEECLQKTFKIVNTIKCENAKIILNTGSVQRDRAVELGLSEMSFKPEHEKNLGNPFSSFANFEMDKYL